MRGSSDSINKELAHSLYRRMLKLVAAAEHPHTQRIGHTRWAEFVPPRVCITQADSLRDVVRRSFEAAYSTTSVPSAFAFLKEALESLFSVWVLAEWERLGKKRQWDLCDGLVLMSAALYGARVGCDTQPALQNCMKDYQLCLRAYVQNMADMVRRKIDVHGLVVGRVEDLTRFVYLVREESTLQRRDATPEDFSVVSLLQHNCASEYVLNIVLLLVLRAVNVNSTVVGSDLAFRWLRVMPRNGASPLFASWSYGAMRRKDVERHIRTADTQWYRAVPWDALQCKSVICTLLRRQLECLPDSPDPPTQRMRSTCKEQVLFLLS
ncbi:putative mitochondrial hypothetical protein [Leptomonas pyrrhocoris]|uniref:Uncharacterized protein n=1 Tax=Leptomonas pyrrhocoris TaxID=157538 RepID=A0A0M9FQL3_LEPPY|nr:putative mitochondrial hypothetical protein [Leptomonas pyrrhocoris]XP_015652436.1 putative mitochondrial hypothetical protein [Leptomonas pyrrhocoris]KPA73996.1 putative mitochondrial hypothetical protein [Leptomonas pyrrhocoris]KPA73997.1 putative mitochondrial hypothetical protein [Leptomonas pyrrhocoris]|eukprot:XP_015652435.1 putative mitochondrial hypothetical protein [Leptomonas pyrrhocoris]